MGVSYDFTVRNFPLPAWSALAVVVPSTVNIMDLGVTYKLTIKSPTILSPSEMYDWFVVEFPMPMYGPQPHTIKCYDNTSVLFSCNIT